MDGSNAARSKDEQDLLVDTDASGEVLVIPEADVQARARVILRDRLIRRVVEEEFLGFARTHGEEAMYLVGFETDAQRIWDRLGLDYRSNVIRDRVERINRLKELALDRNEHISAFIKSESFQAYVVTARFDWMRGKIKRRHEERRSREMANAPSDEDLLWKKIR
ncbi:hypothetical protein K8R04_03780 [Candidatus Uhrbacteria bacterium]|nr:hypothetical protein [Candidatus Uhrbacteria bacterium]